MGSIIKVNEYKDFNNNAIMTSDGSGNVTVNAAALKNTPAFFVKKNSNTNISSATWTTVNFDTVIVDTDSGFNTSTYRYTVPTGGAGKYFIFNTIQGGGSATRSIVEVLSKVGVNGTDKTYAHLSYYNTATGHQLDLASSIILDLSVGDYLDVTGYVNVSSGTPNLQGNSATLRSFFGGYRMIGV